LTPIGRNDDLMKKGLRHSISLSRRLVRKYKYLGSIRRTAQQYLYYRWRFKGDVLLFQVGRFFEFFHVRDRIDTRKDSISDGNKRKGAGISIRSLTPS